MNKIISRVMAACTLAVLATPVFSQGYAGAVLSLSNLSDGCSLPQQCDKRGVGARIYFGDRMQQPLISLGALRVGAVEVGYLRTGKAKSQGVRTVNIVDVGEVDFPVKNTLYADALTMALVGNMPLGSNLSVDVKAGVAYVASTIRYEFNGRSNGSETRNRLSPYLGVGLHFGVLSNMRIGASIDYFRYNVAGESGGVSQLGLGAELDF